MRNKKLNILILSSVSPYVSTNIGLDIMQSLEKAGHGVDFLTKFKFENMLPNMFSVFDYFEPMALTSRIKKKFPFLERIHKPSLRKKKPHKQVLFDLDYMFPPVDAISILKKINKNYDIIITSFWHHMITAKTLKEVYTKIHVPIYILAADMLPMTGGCFYFADCLNFLNFCGNCPSLDSSNRYDLTYKNMIYKKDVYQTIDYYLIGNSWVCNWAQQNPLFDQSKIKKIIGIINENTFIPGNKIEIRRVFNISPGKKIILFAGSQSFKEKRKGFDILIKSINIFASGLTVKQKEGLLLLIAGKVDSDIQKYFNIDIYCPGYLSTELLSAAYSAADCYLSTTVEDAGPLMVCQALMCGTPVVAFEVGVAIDIVITGVTGYKAKCYDIDDYINGIKEIYNYTDNEKKYISDNCRKYAVENFSMRTFAESIEKIYDKIL
ncbi:MAG: glycosyltransferase [Bacteroidales bacterium]|jgi:glycosyltransferase involved in cell wall biosynthesis|nr:glycosyltransferase [Bacteroidales bacterium]